VFPFKFLSSLSILCINYHISVVVAAHLFDGLKLTLTVSSSNMFCGHQTIFHVFIFVVSVCSLSFLSLHPVCYYDDDKAEVICVNFSD